MPYIISIDDIEVGDYLRWSALNGDWQIEKVIELLDEDDEDLGYEGDQYQAVVIDSSRVASIGRIENFKIEDQIEIVNYMKSPLWRVLNA